MDVAGQEVQFDAIAGLGSGVAVQCDPTRTPGMAAGVSERESQRERLDGLRRK